MSKTKKGLLESFEFSNFSLNKNSKREFESFESFSLISHLGLKALKGGL